jgi:DNA-binding NarL/FixJ family response regulator
MPTLRILLIDDHAMFRAGLALVLRSALTGVQVLEAASLDGALRHPDKLTQAPDVVILDIHLEGLNGLNGIALLKRQWPLTPIVMLSSETSSETKRQALALGASAFVSKTETPDHILTTIQAMLGQGVIPTARSDSTSSPTAPARLTARQSEVLDLLSQGLPNKVIGRRLGLTENTVRWHVQAVLELLQVSSRAEAVYVARQRGLIG